MDKSASLNGGVKSSFLSEVRSWPLPLSGVLVSEVVTSIVSEGASYKVCWPVVTNLYTLGDFLADITNNCSIMRADENFLAIIPCMLGLLLECVIDLP